MPAFNLVRRGAYHDSVTLMRLSREMEAVPGVTRAAAMMGTPQNRALLRDAGLLAADGDTATPSDLIVAAVAEREADARAAWAAAERALASTAPRATAAARAPRTLRGGIAALPDASLALISVPGVYAAAEAEKALHAGLHVMLFSDNVPVADEVRLKRLARERGLFLMGPDCGTAILGGVPLGFANAVPRGRIGLAAASGTGLQAVTCHLAAAGEGVSHAIGLGGRDLSDEVSGLMLEPALAALAADPETAVICVVGKAPGPATAKTVRGWLERLGKPWVAHFSGDPSSTAPTLEDTALAAAALARGTTYRGAEFTLAAPAIARLVAGARAALAPGRRYVRGVYAGGTLAQEAGALLRASLGEIATSAPSPAHRVVDLGDDVYTVGRPHPMLDGTVRRDWIAREAADPSTAVLLLDVVLGYGAHPDPAGELAPALSAARAQVAIVASVCGTGGDPQGLARQEETLRAAGVIVMPSNAQAARLAARIAVSLA
ncbi:MAG TPA: acyl-CoA synthetase FdrA [Terriglobales bacterium]|nr:acyl-CoA synthetase FdrA [Terriglobales bacterium]